MPIETTTTKTCDACGDEIETVADLNGNPVERPYAMFGPGDAERLLCIYCEENDTKRAKYVALVVKDAKAVVEASRPNLANQRQTWAILKTLNTDPAKMDAARKKTLETWRTVKKEGA